MLQILVIWTTRVSIPRRPNPPRERSASTTYLKQSQVRRIRLFRLQLLIRITDRYRPLTSFSQKLTFLIDIQIAIFDKYHEKLLSNLEAYLTMTTALGRAMGSVTKEEQERLLGVAGLERLCKTYGSADYLEKAMRDWSDDVVGQRPRHIG
jgi:hypothetical protein